VVLAIAASAALYLNNKEAKEAQAQNQLFLANKALNDQLKKVAATFAPAEPEKKVADKAKPDAKTPPKKEASPEDVLFKKIEVDAQFAESISLLKSVANQHGGTRAAYESLFTLGNLYFRHGNAEKSIEWFQKALNVSPSTFDKALAMSSLAYAYENTGKPADALSYYEKTLNTGEKTLRADTLFSIARIQESMKQKDKAKAYYDQIISEFTETEHARNAELYKSLVE
jgi:Tfp pilus assembly protein PilF